jgi:hypothetical protein
MKTQDKIAHMALGAMVVLIFMLVVSIIAFLGMEIYANSKYNKLMRSQDNLGSTVLDLQKRVIEYTHFSCLPITDAVVLHSNFGQTLLHKANGNVATCKEALGINLKEVRVVMESK